MRRLRSRKRLHGYLLPNFDTKLTKLTPGRSKCIESVMFESSCIDEMCFVYVHPSNELREVSIFGKETGKPREMSIHHTELFGLYDKNRVFAVLYILRYHACHG